MHLFLQVLISLRFRYDEIGPVIGIDFGNAFSRVGIYHNGKVDIIENEAFKSIIPSIVSFNDEQLFVGDSAKTQMISNPKNTIYAIKRLIGRHFYDPEVQKEIIHLPYKVINKNERPYIKIELKDEIRILSTEKVLSLILIKMKRIAENYLGKTINHAVVTIPTYFNDVQRNAIINAGAFAGLDIIKVLNEPSAAVIAYGLDRIDSKKILIFDLGSSTFDVSLVSIEDSMIEFLATNGDKHLGGEDFDNRVVDYFLYLFRHRTGKDASTDAKAVTKLKYEVVKAKHALSKNNQTYIDINNFFDGENLSELFTRSRFEELNMNLFCKMMISVEQIFKDSNIQKNEVDKIILSGGSKKIPKIQQLVSDFFNGKSPLVSINLDEVVVYGAAMEGGIFSEDIDFMYESFIRLNSYSLGIETDGGVMTVLIPSGKTIPAEKKQTFVTSHDNQEYFRVRIFKGENDLTQYNTFLGEFDLTGLPPGPQGTVHIQVTFELYENHILKVIAENNNNKQSITISKINEDKREYYL